VEALILDEKNIALLIDMENLSAKYVKSIFDELTSYGTVSIRRIYGNWKESTDWKEAVLLEYSIQPVQQFNYITSKNASDMAMVIDAMDILYSHSVDIFCIVTSDSDFTKLAMRLRESKVFVIGMGESKTPIALTKACNKFVHLDLISYDEPKAEENGASIKDSTNMKPSKKVESNVTPIKQIQDAVMNMIAESDTIALSRVGDLLNKQFTDFDVRNYGYTKFKTFILE